MNGSSAYAVAIIDLMAIFECHPQTGFAEFSQGAGGRV